MPAEATPPEKGTYEHHKELAERWVEKASSDGAAAQIHATLALGEAVRGLAVMMDYLIDAVRGARS